MTTSHAGAALLILGLLGLAAYMKHQSGGDGSHLAQVLTFPCAGATGLAA